MVGEGEGEGEMVDAEEQKEEGVGADEQRESDREGLRAGVDGTGSGGGVRMPSKEIDKPKGACTCSAAAGKVKSASGQTEGTAR